MGNAESAIVRNVDKRTSRREHRAHFEAAVERFRKTPFAAPPRPEGSGGGGGPGDEDRFVRVCVRKRPIFKHELEQGEFDVVTCLPGRVVVHDARMHADMTNMFVNHHDFAFDEAFDETVGNDEVYDRTAKELVQSTLEGRCSTVMMYGQTGSGKTYTMSSIYERVVEDLFAGAGDRTVTTSFIELAGDKSHDMLNAGEECKLQQAGDGSVHPFPCVEVQVKTSDELLSLIQLAAKLRVTAATGVHDQSSRSHAVCRIFVDAPHGSEYEGSLTLVDLAGSEHRVDSNEHNAERRKEGAKINASLAALKDCIRAASRNAKFVAFRQNRLTQVLRGCFSRLERHQTVVIATVSPSSKDTEHSMNTLRHACIMDGQGEQKSTDGAHVAGGVVTKEKIGSIDVTKIARERKAAAKENPPDNWGKPEVGQPAHQLKKSNLAARAALDRKAVRALPQSMQDAVMAARAEWGSDRQRRRIGRAGSFAVLAEEAAQAEAAQAAAAAAEREENRRQGQREERMAEASRTRASREQSGEEALAPAPGELALGNEALAAAVEAAGPDGLKALELFKTYLAMGRDGYAWRKNDLRLVNVVVVPALFGDGASIDWNHPPLALDDLESLLRDAPEVLQSVNRKLNSAGGASKSAPSRPPRPPSGGDAARPSGYPDTGPAATASGSGAPGQRRLSQGAAALSSASARPPLRRSSEGGEGDSSASSLHARRPSSGGSYQETPSPSAPSSAGSSVRSNSSQRDAVRLRREAMEKARKESLQKALGKKEQPANPAGTGETEIEALENQIASGAQSAAAVVGLKKRLATLKAAAVREQRAAEARRRAAQAQQERPPPPPSQAAPAVAQQEQPRRSVPSSPYGAAQSGGGTPYGGTPHRGSQHNDGGWLAEERWPEPAIPPPRFAPSPLASDCRLQSELMAVASAQRKRASPTGAAAAPWGNSFTDD
mmetsp:Transcript_20587/g.71211  ORF Transcript_20587/g.71211 Transcript_20587/m.71211 type:complete len:947 (+) Transcript_20587:93-2933(+)